MKLLKKMRYIFSILLVVSLLFSGTPVVHGFIASGQSEGASPLDAYKLLITKVHKPQWKIGYRYHVDCKPSERQNSKELEEAMTASLRAWLEPLKKLQPERPIVDKFVYELQPDFDPNQFNQFDHNQPEDVERIREILREEFRDVDLRVTFDCTQGGSSAGIGLLFPPAVIMRVGTELTPSMHFTLTHEFGHAFGLADTYARPGYMRNRGGLSSTAGTQPASVMAGYPHDRFGDTPFGIGEDDKRGIVWLYKHFYEDIAKGDCFFPDYVFVEEPRGCRPKYPLIFETKHSHPDIALQLLKDDPTIDVNAQDVGGMTALHYAVIHEKEEVVKTLLAHKDINPSLMNKRGQTPLDIALAANHTAIIKMFHERPRRQEDVNNDDVINISDLVAVAAKSDVHTVTLRNTLTGDIGAVLSVAFSPDGKTIASGSSDGTIRLWDIATVTLKNTLTEDIGAVLSVAFSPDGKTIASGLGGYKGYTTIRLWDVATGTLKNTLTGHTDSVHSVAFSPDGNTLASGSGSSGSYVDYTIRLWDVATGTLKNTLTGHARPVRSVAFSPDGKIIASGSSDGTIRLWDVATGTLKNTFTGRIGFVNSVAFSPDGNTLASGSEQSDKTISLWDVATGTLKNTLTGHTDGVLSVAFSPDGNTIASGSYDATIRLWDVATGTLKNTLTGHTDWVRSVAFSPDGNTLASGSQGTVLLWDIAPAEPPRLAADVNADGTVNIQDLVWVAGAFGQQVPETGDPADVNGDGTVNIQDLVAVAAAFGEAAADAPSAAALSSETVQQWLSAANQLSLTDTRSQRGIRFLEQLLLALTPKETVLLPNYPNPFNPETWIPYQLSAPGDVRIEIHAIDGTLIRTLSLGHQPAGIYQSRSRAAYWNGKNAQSEPIASGVYFYTLTAGDFTATRKMLIRK